ncbi:hypothetical protein [Halothiobacillus sp.]|uniref:IS66 family transposase n=1 Tax=Halothiobacillus sp. TaxID=1891311 RepID=UPI0026222647|nr:hypothetical protein [Halothiobacillus sp.]
MDTFINLTPPACQRRYHPAEFKVQQIALCQQPGASVASVALELKNQKLTHELAYYRCIPFGAKTEAMSAEQLHLFEDDLAQDVAAVEAQFSPPCRCTAQD